MILYALTGGTALAALLYALDLLWGAHRSP